MVGEKTVKVAKKGERVESVVSKRRGSIKKRENSEDRKVGWGERSYC